MQYTGLNWDQLSFPETFFFKLDGTLKKQCVCVYLLLMVANDF